MNQLLSGISRTERIIFLLFCAFFIANLTLHLSGTMLWDEDEVAYASFARRMVKTGDYLTQYALWCDIHRKPPLHFYTIAFWYKLLGVKEWITRLPSVFATIGTLLSLFFGLRKVWSERLAVWSVMVLGSSILIPNIGKISVLDAELLGYETMAAVAMLNVLHQKSWKWSLLFWVSFALGVFQKGPPIMILCGGMFFFLAIFHKNGRNLWSMQPFIGLPLAMLPLLIWGWLSWKHDNGVLVKFLWDWYILKRTGDDNVVSRTWTGPGGYHLGILAASFLVWLPFFVAALIDVIKKTWQRNNNAIFMMSWLIFGWFFYEFMSTKLPAYSIAAQPAIVILIAQQVVDFIENSSFFNKNQLIFSSIFNNNDENTIYPYGKWLKSISVLQGIILIALGVGLIIASNKLFGFFPAKNLVPVIFVCWAGAITTIWLVFKEKTTAPLAMLATGLLLTFTIWLNVQPLIENKRNATKRAAKTARQLCGIRNDVALVCALDAGNNMPSILFYGESYFKMITDPTRYEDDLYWYKGTTPAVFIIDKDNYDRNFKNIVPPQSIVKVPIWLVDRGKESAYYVFKNF